MISEFFGVGTFWGCNKEVVMKVGEIEFQEVGEDWCQDVGICNVGFEFFKVFCLVKGNDKQVLTGNEAKFRVVNIVVV